MTYLDLTYSGGSKKLDFKVVARQLPNLKGLAVSTNIRLAFVFGKVLWLQYHCCSVLRVQLRPFSYD